MGTIVDKFNYSFEAKDLIKDSINNLGGSITSETELKEYAQELDNIYDNLPKTTGEDTNLSLTTLKGKMNIIPKGDTNQYTTTGKNLFNIDTPLQAGSTSYINLQNNSFTLDRTNNRVMNFNHTSISLPAGTYTLFFRAKPSQVTITSGVLIGMYIKNSSQNNLGYINFYYNNSTGYAIGTTTISETGSYIYFFLANDETSSTTAVISDVMILSGSYTYSNILPYEPYTNGASPNPTYPQNIEVVTGTQVVTISNSDNTETQTQTLSLGNIELCKIGNYQDYLYKTSGKNLANESEIQIGKSWNNTSNTSRATILFIPLESGVTYSFASAYTNSHITSIRAVLNYGIDNDNRNLVVNTTSFSTDTYTHVSLEILADTTFTQSMLEGTKIFLCKGEGTIANYEPYGSDKWYKKEYIGKVVLNGSENWIKSNSRFHTAIPSANGNYVVSALCREYIEVSTHDIHANTNYSFIVCNSGWGVDHCRISFNNSDYASVDSWKNALTTNNIIVYYQLTNELGGANDIEITNETLIEQLDNLQKLKSYNGVTNINCSGNLSAILSVSALKGE